MTGEKKVRYVYTRPDGIAESSEKVIEKAVVKAVSVQQNNSVWFS